jgi:hypothetical protein
MEKPIQLDYPIFKLLTFELEGFTQPIFLNIYSLNRKKKKCNMVLE